MDQEEFEQELVARAESGDRDAAIELIGVLADALGNGTLPFNATRMHFVTALSRIYADPSSAAQALGFKRKRGQKDKPANTPVPLEMAATALLIRTVSSQASTRDAVQMIMAAAGKDESHIYDALRDHQPLENQDVDARLLLHLGGSIAKTVAEHTYTDSRLRVIGNQIADFIASEKCEFR